MLFEISQYCDCHLILEKKQKTDIIGFRMGVEQGAIFTLGIFAITLAMYSIWSSYSTYKNSSKTNKKSSPYNAFVNIVILCSVFIMFLLVFFIEPHNLMSNSFEDLPFLTETDLTSYFREQNVNSILSRNIDELYSDIITSFENSQINLSQQVAVRNELSQASRYYEESKNEFNITKRNQTLYIAFSYFMKADSLFSFHRFNTCYQKTKNTENKYHPLFYYLKFEDKKRLSKYEKFLSQHKSMLSSRRINIDNSPHDSVLNYVGEFQKFEREAFNNYLECVIFGQHLLDDWNYQHNLYFIKFFLLLTVLLMFNPFLIKFVIKSYKSFMKKSSKFETKVYDWKKQNVNIKVIKIIPRMGSIITVLVSLGIAFITLFNESGVVFLGLSIVCTLLLLFSMAVALFSLNNPSNLFLRQLCFRSFILAIFLFIIIIVYIFFILLVMNIGESIKTSITLFFNSTNQR